MAGPKGLGALGMHAPFQSNFFHFMQFSAIFFQIIVGAPFSGVVDPLGNAGSATDMISLIPLNVISAN